MSSGTWSNSTSVDSRAAQAGAITPYAILRALGSLKITVTLFALGILIVLIGTLAQDDETLVEVKREYFNAWVASIPLDVFVPSTIYPHERINGSIPFPGGATIGLALLLNLIAAKATRFSISAKGAKLVVGLIVSLLGAILVSAVILTGHTTDGLQGAPPISYDQLWAGVKVGLLVIALAIAGYALWATHLPKLAKVTLWSMVAILGPLSIWLLLSNARIDDPGLRIVWQLFQATVASSVCLAGLMILFGKRGGNMLIHIGIALLMVGQFVFADRQIEQKVFLSEGGTASVTFIPDQLEIAFVDTSGPSEDTVTVVPDARIRQALKADGLIDDPALPCLLRVDRWMQNSRLESISSAPEIKATIGTGLVQQAIETAPNGGAKSSPNIPSAYVTLLDRQSKQPLETLLLSQEVNDGSQLFRNGAEQYEKVSLSGKPYEIALRYRKEYKPYQITLKDVTRRDYANSNTPRDYSSVISIRNPETGEEISDVKTWMNNPVRFGGETFYQSDYFPVMLPNGTVGEGSGLQVVKNAGWVIPYVCCMMVMVGMFSHFGGTFLRFANRVAREKSAQPATLYSDFIKYGLVGFSIAGCLALYGLKGNRYGVVEADWNAIGRLPVKQDGRVKPADSVAANTLQALSEPVFGGTPYVVDGDGKKRSRVEWMFAVMADVPWTKDVQIFRVYAKEVRELLGLDDNRDKFRYTYNEISKNREAFFAEVDKLREKSRKQIELNFREQKISEMYSKLTSYELLSAAYDEPALPRLDSDKEEDFRAAMIKLDELDRRYKIIEDMNPAAFIPPLSASDSKSDSKADAAWVAYGPAKFDSILQRVRGIEPNPAVESFANLLEAVRTQNSKEIDDAARKYRVVVTDSEEAKSNQGRSNAEAWLNGFNPTSIGILGYIVANIFGFASFASSKASKLSYTAFGVIVGIFVIHTATLMIRMYISGRAPVVNLYSSAVFIGWACVLLCLVLEVVMRLGFANIVGSAIGLITLSIARSLDKSDTLHVLAAVLDTQFWLSTHVVAITVGYAVTYLAGFFGAVVLLKMVFDRYAPHFAKAVNNLTGVKMFQETHLKTPVISEQAEPYKQLYRMAYFSVCFGILFSFVGTVLGGLWADDSWGRFWGWDPKENGALMIVLWNALVLHARWDRMVGLRGFSVLALVGNIVTSWSWFGTNLLGIGLHNYGFNKSVAYALVVTVIVHVALIVVAMVSTSGKSNSSLSANASE